jgi:tetratricopeptide (TPR) repeat protein
MNKKQIIGVIVLIVLVLVFGFLVYKDITNVDKALINIEAENNQRMEFKGDNAVELPQTNNDNILIEEIETEVQLPDLKRHERYNFSGDLPESVVYALNEIERISNLLLVDSGDLNNWLALANHRETVKDYSGAEEVLIYTEIVWPDEARAFYHAGDLYMSYFKLYSVAEGHLSRAIEIDPAYVDAYMSLSGIYQTEVMKDLDRAEAILLGGLDKNPSSIRMMTVLALFYKQTGDFTPSRQYYTQALNEAKRIGDVQQQAAIEKVLATLPEN